MSVWLGMRDTMVTSKSHAPATAPGRISRYDVKVRLFDNPNLEILETQVERFTW